MLSGLLEKSTCAECRLCCAFDRYDIWELPTLDGETAAKALGINPSVRLSVKNNSYSFKVTDLEGDELFFCPMLSDTGCVLGDEKPFECRIWPYRIMSLDDKLVISVAPICEPVFDKPLSELVRFLKGGLADKIFEYASNNPDIIKPYDNLYPILMVKS